MEGSCVFSKESMAKLDSSNDEGRITQALPSLHPPDD